MWISGSFVDWKMLAPCLLINDMDDSSPRCRSSHARKDANSPIGRSIRKGGPDRGRCDHGYLAGAPTIRARVARVDGVWPKLRSGSIRQALLREPLSAIQTSST